MVGVPSGGLTSASTTSCACMARGDMGTCSRVVARCAGGAAGLAFLGDDSSAPERAGVMTKPSRNPAAEISDFSTVCRSTHMSRRYAIVSSTRRGTAGGSAVPVLLPAASSTPPSDARRGRESGDGAGEDAAGRAAVTSSSVGKNAAPGRP